jgi:cardiolipin synthase
MLPAGSFGIFFFLEFALRVYFIIKIVGRRLPVGVSWAWISLLLSFPLIGTFAYLNLGEYRLGRRRSERISSVGNAIKKLVDLFSVSHAPSSPLPETSQAFAQAVTGFFGSPVISGNDVELLRGADETFPCLIADIDAAKTSCDLEFYIWSDGGRADEVGEALTRAVGRGVRCRLLADQVGSSAFLKGKMSKRLVSAGVELSVALPSGLIRSIFTRPDLRIHRKIVVIDGHVAYTGSINLADPVYFKKNAGVGQWVDAFCRVQGPAVRALEVVFLSDWCGENQTDFVEKEKEFSFRDSSVKKTAQIQCIASGPAIKSSPIEQTLVTAIYSAKNKLTLTTPYFVPDEQLLYALIAAASKGVEVTLIVPAKADSRFVQYASHAFLRDLTEAGVRVELFTDGLLHTKSVTVDGEFCLFGSLNLDPRSLRINFEITLAIYERDFVRELENLQASYLRKSRRFDSSRPTSRWIRFQDDLARLLGPVL